MHFHFNLSAVQAIWTLVFAALLVLLVVLLGRERAQKYPWFTTYVAIMALQRLVGRILFERMALIPAAFVVSSLAILVVLARLLVVEELARKAFAGVKTAVWAAWAAVVVAISGAIVAFGTPWPTRQALSGTSQQAILRLMQLVSQRGEMLTALLFIGLGLPIVLFGRRHRAGWRSYPQQIAIGLSTAAISQLAMTFIGLAIAMKVVLHSREEYQRVIDLLTRFSNANDVVYLAVLVWWIAWLWADEPGAEPAPAAEDAQPTEL